MIIGIVPLLVLGFASYRITRFLIIDDLISGIRDRFLTFFVNQSQKEGKFHLVWNKAYALFTCTWCAGFWITLSLYWIYLWTSPWYFSRLDWISIFAITGVQGLLHAWEPDDSE